MYHLPPAFHKVFDLSTSITFGGKGEHKVQVISIDCIIVRVPPPGATYFDFWSLLISNDIEMLLGLSTQTKLRMITDKDPDKPNATFRFVGVTVTLVRKFGHLYYEGSLPFEYLFSSTELAQIHRNLGHAPLGSVYSAL